MFEVFVDGIGLFRERLVEVCSSSQSQYDTREMVSEIIDEACQLQDEIRKDGRHGCTFRVFEACSRRTRLSLGAI